MANVFLEYFKSIDFFEVQETFQDIGLYDYLFPYLLVYSLLVTIFPYVGIFQNKEGKPRKPIITLLSLIISFYGVSFEISQGQTIGMLLMNLFPNISALTIGILAFYIVGAILGVDVFKGLFRKDFDAYIYLTIGGIALGMVIYYLGISFGLWNYDPLDTGSMWNVIIALLLSILAVVLIIAGKFILGTLFAIVVLSWVFGAQNESILMSFVDPILLILFLFLFFLSWVNKGDDEKQILAKELEKSRVAVEKYEKENGKVSDYFSRVNDINQQNYLDKLKKWKEKYGEEDHKKSI